jgi:hypothetical protein
MIKDKKIFYSENDLNYGQGVMKWRVLKDRGCGKYYSRGGGRYSKVETYKQFVCFVVPTEIQTKIVDMLRNGGVLVKINDNGITIRKSQQKLALKVYENNNLKPPISLRY